jgi:hypothetical protein
VGRLTTPGVTPDPATRARASIGTALGIVAPTAVPLRDGRVWLTGGNDVLPAHIARRMEEQLARRAADRVSDDRMLAEAVGVLGAEIARARGESPEAGATDALDRFLHLPGLDQSRRAEGEAMLRLALRLAARESDEAAERLARMPGEPRVPVASEIVSASQQISRDAGLLATANQPDPVPRRTGRHRAPVGVRQGRTAVRVVRGSGLDTRNTPAADPGQSELAALAALTQLSEVDLGSAVTSRPAITSRPAVDPQRRNRRGAEGKQSLLATITVAQRDAPQHIRVEILPTSRGLAAEGTRGSGTAQDPHVLRISPGLPEHQYRQVWVRHLSQMTQQMEAEQAGRPRGILGRLRSAIGSERREQRLNADYAAFQQLSRDWQQARAETAAYGRPLGPRTVGELQRDLNLQAGAIWWRSGSMPALPWARDSIYSPSAAADGVAAERAVAEATPEPNTPGHLRQQVVEQIASLEAAVADLEAKADYKATTAMNAADQATSKEDQAAGEDQLNDRGAPERARRLRDDAEKEFSKARRHTEMSHAYRQAQNDAGQALAGYQALLARLDDPDHRPDEIAELAREAADRTGTYQASLRDALPIDHLESGVPTDRPLLLPVEEINEMFPDGVEIDAEAPVPEPAAYYRRLFSDGMVFPAKGRPTDDVSEVHEYRVRVVASNVTEETGLTYDLAEQMSGTLGEGGHNESTTATHATNVNYGVNLQPFLAAAPPGSPLHAASQVFAPGLNVGTGESLSETAGASMHGQLGWVDVHKGESLPYSWDAKFEIQVRTSPTAPWSPVKTVDAGKQLTWVPSPYTVKAPTETVTLEQLGHEGDLDDKFPRLTVTRISGLQSISDRLVTEAREKLGPIDRIGYAAINQRITDAPYRLLGEFAKPGGLSRTIPVGGESAYDLTLIMEPDWSSTKLVGEPSRETGQEKVQVNFGGVNASRSSGTSLTGGASIGFPGNPDPSQPVPAYLPSPTALTDLGHTTADLSLNVSAGRNVSRQGGLNLSTTAITPVVDREMEATQGTLTTYKVTAILTSRKDPAAEPVVVTDTCEVKGRLTQNRLLRAGGPAGKDAVQRDEAGAIRLDQDGRALLAGDPEPPTGPQTLPPFHGTGPNQMRGTGKALPDELEGVDEARQQALTRLSEMGLVPPLDKNFKPVEPVGGVRPSDRRRAGQKANYDRVMEDFSDFNIVGGMNSACQAGLLITLVDHRLGHAPQRRNFRLSVTQDFDDVRPAGTSTSKFITRLAISSRALQRFVGRSSSVPVSAGVGLTNGPEEGQAGWAARIGAKLSRNALIRNFSETVGGRVSRVLLHESTNSTDDLRQGVRITLTEVTPDGDSEPLADVRGSMKVTYDSTLTRAEQPVFEADPTPPHPEAVKASKAVAMDAGNPADRLCSAVPAFRADSTAYMMLHSALSPEIMLSNTEWLTERRYEVPLAVTPAPANPAQAFEERTLLPQQFTVVIRSEPVSQTFLAMNDQNSADINFTMVDTGFTSGTATSGGVSGEAGGGPVEASTGPVDADESQLSGKVGVGRVGGRSQSTGTSQTSGDERLLVYTDVHYDLLERHRLVADVVQDGKVIQTVPLQDALVQKIIPEYTALELYGREEFDLPVPIAADVAERFLTNKVEPPPRTAAAFVRRYKRETNGITAGLPAEHTAERLSQKVLAGSEVEQSTAPTPDERLADTLDRTEELANTPRRVGMPVHYKKTLASSQPHKIKVEGQPEQDADLLPQIHEQIEEIAPGWLAADPLLTPALESALAKDSYHVLVKNMLGPRGHTLPPMEIPVPGQAQPDLLLVTTKAGFEGAATVDGTPGLPKVPAIRIGQHYGYDGLELSVGHSTTHSGNVGLNAENADGASGSGSVASDRTRQVAAGSRVDNTSLYGTLDPELTPVSRGIVFTTEVVRIHAGGAGAMSSTRWRLSRKTPAAQTTAAQPRQLRAVFTPLVPSGVVGDAPDPDVQQTPAALHPEHRALQLPEGAVVEAMLPYREGGAETDELFNAVTGYLGRPDVLGPGGLAEHETAIGTQLSPIAMEARLEHLVSPGGLKLEPIAGRGNGRTTFAVRINARPVGCELVTEPLPGQTRLVRRGQHQAKTSTTGNRLLPVTATGGLNSGVYSVSASVGEQVKEQSSDATGTRFETSMFRDGDVVTVRFPMVYGVTIDERIDKGRGDPAIKKSTYLEDAARGEYYVRMQYHEYLEILRTREASGDVSLEGGRLQAMPDKFGKPDLRATHNEHQPYQPLLAAIDKARADKTAVVLAVQEADGTERLYKAIPVLDKDGNVERVGLAGDADGGYATAFGKLDRRLVQMAEQRVDLRELFNTMPPDGNFNSRVASALEQSGVPTSVLKGLDYATTARQTTPPATGQGEKPSIGGRTITPAPSGPSLAGP